MPISTDSEGEGPMADGGQEFDADVEMRCLHQEGEVDRKDSGIDVEMRDEQEGEEEMIGKDTIFRHKL